VKSHFLVRASGLHRMAPWVAFHHCYTWPNRKMRLYNQLDRWSLRAARQVLTVSGPFRDELVSRGVSPHRIKVIHNAVDPEWGSATAGPERAIALRETLGIAPGKRVILIVGRLSREKDHHTLLEAVRGLRDANSGGAALRPHLLIVGDGPERARIEQTIRALDLTGDVTLTGHVPTTEPYYAVADIAVLSSLSEGSPNALLEAMAARVPIVATAVGGIPEMVCDHDSALLVRPGDREAITGAVAELMTDDALCRRLTDRARELILLRHESGSRARCLVEIYTGLLPRPPGE
jgi:glycosyltransferase involved in cell wall biosynthesis